MLRKAFNIGLDALKWAYTGSFKYIAWLVAMYVFIAFGMSFLAYPLLWVISIVVTFVAVVLFMFVSEWK